MRNNERPNHVPAQHQDKQPGIESEMVPRPKSENNEQIGTNKLLDKVALITGGDSGIGRAVAIAFAKEGADIFISYLDEHDDARETKKLVEKYGRRCELLSGDISNDEFCQQLIAKTLAAMGKLNILVNNAAVQYPQDSIKKITKQQLEKTFSTNIFSYFYVTRSAVCHLKGGGVIINTTSVTAYRGSPKLIDYSATKGAIVSFTRSLALSLIKEDIRVNGVAPGPIWTPLIPSSFSEEEVAEFGDSVPMKRIGQPDEVSACYVFLASKDSSYMTGQILHPNGGVIVNG